MPRQSLISLPKPLNLDADTTQEKEAKRVLLNVIVGGEIWAKQGKLMRAGPVLSMGLTGNGDPRWQGQMRPGSFVRCSGGSWDRSQDRKDKIHCTFFVVC